MEENASGESKDLAIQEQIKANFEKIITEIINNMENESATVTIEGSNANISINIQKEKEGYKLSLLGEEIINIDKNGEFRYNIENLQNLKEKLEDKDRPIANYEELGLPDIEYLKEIEMQKDENLDEMQKDDKDLSKELKDESEKDNEQSKKGEQRKEDKEIENNEEWQEMDLDREFSDSDNLRVWIKEKLGVSPERLYRRQVGAHDFQYIAETNGKKETLDLSTDREGKNTTQRVYVVQEDGTLTLEEVDSLLLTKNGNYGIATKVPDGVATDVTKSFEVKRTKDGKYVATRLIEKSGMYRDANEAGKEIADNNKSIYDIEEDIDIAEDVKDKDMNVAKDGVTVNEIDIIKELKKEGWKDREIDRIIKRCQENDISLEESKEEERKIREKEDEEYVGYGQRRPH